MLFCAIMAGGIGTRMGNALPKQLVTVGGEPIIVRTLRRFAEAADFDATVICSPAAYIDMTSELLKEYGCMSDKVSVIEGGENRNKSVINACRFLSGISQEPEDIIVTHDAVRPFVTSRIISQGIELARLHGASNTVVPTVDTLLESSDGVFAATTPDRSRFYRVQTPQSFCLSTLCTVFDNATEAELAECTDTAGLFLRHGHEVALVRGEECNIKITTPFDLAVAQAFIDKSEFGGGT